MYVNVFIKVHISVVLQLRMQYIDIPKAVHPQYIPKMQPNKMLRFSIYLFQ
jgi:hypothetical protein